MRNRVTGLILLLCATSLFAAPDPKITAAAPQLEKILASFYEKQHIPGVAVGVVANGGLTWLKTTGVRDVAAQAPVTPDTVFRIASMTKSFTSMAILKLRDEGKLSLDDPASKYVPELAGLQYPTKDSPPITIRMLLTHSEGFPEDNPWGDRQLSRSDATMSAWMKAGIPFSTSPGTSYEYSNYGFAILGQIVQRVSKQPYAQYVTEAILKPLGMTSTTYDAASVPPDKIAKGYRWDAASKKWLDEPALPHGAFGAMGGLWTTPHDLAQYVAFLLSAFPPRDDAESGPVRRSSAREMQQAWRSSGPIYASRDPLNGPLQLFASSYAYGLGVGQDCRFSYIVQHGGGLPGYGSFEEWLPEYGVGVIAFGNVTYAGMRALTHEMLIALYSAGALQKRAPQPSPALLQAKNDVTSLILHWDDALAQKIAAENLFLDRSAGERKEEIAKLLASHGACRAASAIEAENALRGEWEMPCEKGSLRVRITLAPTEPPTVQYLAIRSILPPTTEARDLITAELPKIPAEWGKCAIADALGENVVRLNCDRGALVARVTEGKVNISPLRDPDHRCAP